MVIVNTNVVHTPPPNPRGLFFYGALSMFPALSVPFKLHTAPIFDDRTEFRLMIAKFPGNNQEHPASSDWIARTVLESSQYDSISNIQLA
jgi:hypothetical protein